MTSRVPSRRPNLYALVLLSFAVLIPGTAGAVTITPEQAEIANFGQVNENYFRGSQPDGPAFQRLGSLGVKTVIDLQEKSKPEEPDWVRDAGMKYFCIPLSGNHPANDTQTVRFLELVNDPQNWPVYVHCARGKHRTGEMTGIYRITHDTWTADHAYGEMKKYGYYSFPFHGSLKDYVFDYYESHRGASTATLAKAAATSDSLPAIASAASVPAAVVLTQSGR